MDRGKIVKNLRTDMLILGILELIIVVYYIVALGNAPIPNIIFLGALMAGYMGAKQEKQYVSYIGIAIGSLMIMTIFMGDLIDLILGIFVLKDSVKYLKNIK